MKHLAAFLLLILCLLTPAHAETVGIGNATIPYAAPEGFRRVDGMFPLQLADLDAQFGMNTVIFAQYVPAAYAEIRQKDAQALPLWYIHLAYDSFFSKVSIGRASFASTTWLVESVLAKQYADKNFLQKLEDLIAGAINRKIAIETMQHHGVVEKKSNSRSLLALGHSKLETASGMVDFTFATMTTFCLVQGKLLTIVQIGQLQSEAELPAFTQKALRIAAQISN